MRVSVESPSFNIQAAAIEQLFKNFPIWSGNEALLFYKESFTRQGYTGKTFRRWKARKDKDSSRNLLVGHGGGRLRRSLRKRTIQDGWEIYTDTPYAKIHNEGGHITARVTVRTHKRRRRSGGFTRVKSHSRKMNTRIPQRQFMDIQLNGLSPALQKRFVRHLNRGIKQVLKR